jgi:hypothetical protein
LMDILFGTRVMVLRTEHASIWWVYNHKHDHRLATVSQHQ